MITQLGKMFLVIGVCVAVVGLILVVSPKIPWIGHLPGDISIHRHHFHVTFPLATSIIVSVLLTLLLNLFRR